MRDQSENIFCVRITKIWPVNSVVGPTFHPTVWMVGGWVCGHKLNDWTGGGRGLVLLLRCACFYYYYCTHCVEAVDSGGEATEKSRADEGLCGRMVDCWAVLGFN